MHSIYLLKHKNDNCAILSIDSNNGAIEAFKPLNDKLLPFLGKADLSLMRTWWQARAVPASRDSMREVIRRAGAHNPEDYLAKNLALSMTDSYWLCPETDLGLKWEVVNFQNLIDYNNGKIPFHSEKSYDPNGSLGGQMDKYWDITTDPATLVKNGYKYCGQQSVNEVFATLLHSRQPHASAYVSYEAMKIPNDNGIMSKCKSFIEPGLEFVPSLEIIYSTAGVNSESQYERFIRICVENGMSEEIVRDFLDYQTLTDFIITNTDRHNENYGVLRDIDSLKFVKPAPIFDSGNSMLHSYTGNTPLDSVELLSMTITAMHDKEERMLKHINNRNIVDVDSLPEFNDIVELYTSFGIPEQKALVISNAYLTKVSMVKEFQKGKTISLYNEKQKQREQSKTQKNATPEHNTESNINL